MPVTLRRLALGAALQDVMIRAHLYQRQMSARLGRSESYVSRLLSGECHALPEVVTQWLDVCEVTGQRRLEILALRSPCPYCDCSCDHTGCCVAAGTVRQGRSAALGAALETVMRDAGLSRTQMQGLIGRGHWYLSHVLSGNRGVSPKVVTQWLDVCEVTGQRRLEILALRPPCRLCGCRCDHGDQAVTPAG